MLDIDGNVVDLGGGDLYKGNVLVIMNVASEWGLAKTNYLELQGPSKITMMMMMMTMAREDDDDQEDDYDDDDDDDDEINDAHLPR